MGLIDAALGVVFGKGRNVIRDTVEVFRENSDAAAQRSREIQGEAMKQFGAEFVAPRQGGFDRFMDGVNRLPRPALALGILGLFVAAMVDPLWFAARMQGLALAPEPLWWLLGVVVSFYFGARHQAKTQTFQREIAATIAQAPMVAQNIKALNALRAESPGVADSGPDGRLTLTSVASAENPALQDWKALRGA